MLICLLASAGCGSVDGGAHDRLFGNTTSSGGRGGAASVNGGTPACEGAACGGTTCVDGNGPGCNVRPTTPPCAPSQKECGGLCVDPSPGNGCGDPACTACPQVANGQSACRGDECGFDCNAGFVPDGASCVPPAPACTDGTKNGTETDTDCGGTCPRCAGGMACDHGADCLSAACVNSLCATASCTNGVQDSAETDIDCGGSACPPCAAGMRCHIGSDCADGTCLEGSCRASTCADRTKNGNETDIDCGGSCGPCALNARCAADDDCMSGHCASGVCRQPCASPNSANGCPACAVTTASACCSLNQYCGCTVIVRNSPFCL